LQTGGGKVERRRREYRGAEGAEEGRVWGGGFLFPTGGRLLVHSERYFFTVQLPTVQARNTAFGLTKLAAAACMEYTA